MVRYGPLAGEKKNTTKQVEISTAFSPLRLAWRRTKQPSWLPRSCPVGWWKEVWPHTRFVDPSHQPLFRRFFLVKGLTFLTSGRAEKGIKGSFTHTLVVSWMFWSCFFLLCTVWNHHWTTIWDRIVLLFPSILNSRKSKERKRKCHPTKSQADAFAAFDAAQSNNEAAALRGVVWFETSWECFLGSGGWWSELEELQGQLFIQSQDRWVVSNPVWIVYPKACGNDTIGRLHLFSHGCFNH